MVELGATQIASGDRSFSSVVGQEELKEALLAVAANDALDGVLVRGEKGTAKSTTVRALASLLPDQQVVADCPYGCPPEAPDRQCEDCQDREDLPVETRPVPLVTLPLGATRERVVGSLSVADALAGDYEFEPGLLARANRGILYVDEVNLLDDHLVDVLLDAAASGLNRVERDSVSVTHPAEFTLVGTMNPEEGDLRPQLRDRFALQATVTACSDIEDRVAIIEQALHGPPAGQGDDAVRERLLGARERLAGVTLPDSLAADIAELCRDAGVEGHRGDIATARTARTFAALDDRETVSERDVQRAAELALPHRLQSRPFEDSPAPEDVVEDHFEDSAEPNDSEEDERKDTDDSDGQRGSDGSADDENTSEPDADDANDTPEEQSGPERRNSDEGSNGRGMGGDGDSGCDDAGGSPGSGQLPAKTEHTADGSRDGEESSTEEGEDQQGEDEATPLVPGQARTAVAAVGDSSAPSIETPHADGSDARPGSRAQTDPGTDTTGPRVRTQRVDEGGNVDAAASVRAAASRGESSVESRDLRQSVRAGDSSTLVVFAVDASASMRPAMRTAKGTVLELLKDAYQHRDEVAFVAFAGDDAEVLLPPTDSVTLAARHLKELPTGDTTPLPAGLDTASEVIERADPAASAVVVVTDGRTNAADNPVADTRTAARRLAQHDPTVLVVEAGNGGRAGLIQELVDATDADRVPLEALSAGSVDERLRE